MKRTFTHRPARDFAGGRLILTVALLLALTGCDTLNNNEPEVAAMTAEDLEVASDLMADALADQSEGLMADLNDMTARVEIQRMVYAGRDFGQNPGLRPCRGLNRNYARNYDPATGTFTISYSRSHEAENCSKSMEINLQYVFTDSTGAFIVDPLMQRREIAEIAFEGSRNGMASYDYGNGNTREVTTDQKADWNLAGLNGTAPFATLAGTQTKDGSYSKTVGDSLTKSGTYSLTMETVDVTIQQGAMTDDDDSELETKITGTIQYTLTMSQTINGVTERKETEGTIDLEGDGHALLRFLGLKQIFRVNLRDGKHERHDDDRDDRGDRDDDDDDDNDGRDG